MAFIALDLGSSFTKAAVLADGCVLAERQLPALAPLAGGQGRFEIDAEQYFRQVRTLLDELLDAAPAEGVLLSTQMHGYVLTDEDNRPVTPFVSWQDKLGGLHLPAISRVITAQDVLPSGVPLKGNLALCSLLARQAEGFSLPANVRFHTLGGYVIARLCGAHVCHITNAAPTGLADVRRAGWNAALLEKAGLSGLRMPDVLPSLTPVGCYRGVPLYPDVGDQQACAYGAGLSPDTSLHVNIGTAGLLGALSAEFAVDGFESRPWLEPGLYLRTVSGLMGGRNVAAARSAIPGDDNSVWAMLTTQPPAEALALYEAMAEQYRQAADRMHLNVRKLHYSGGCVIKNPALRRCIEARFGVTPQPDEPHSDIWTGMATMARHVREQH